MPVDKALLCFAWDSPEAFTLIKNQARAMELMRLLIREGMDEESLLKRVCRNLFADELFIMLVEEFKGTEHWLRFSRAVVTLPHKCWVSEDGGLSEQLVITHFVPLLDQLSLFKLHREVEGDPYHPLFTCLLADPYWLGRVRFYLQRRDYFAAWKDIQRSKQGIPVSSLRPTNAREVVLFQQYPEGLCYRATGDGRNRMVAELFEAMAVHGTVASLTSTDYVLTRSRSQAVRDIPGLPFVLSTGQAEVHQVRGAYEYRLYPAGAMVIKLAGVLAKRAQQARRAKPLPLRRTRSEPPTIH